MTIEQALDRLLEVGGSDILISCGSPPRLRRDGRLEALDGVLLTPAAIEPMVRGLLDESQWQELQTDLRRSPRDFGLTADTWNGRSLSRHLQSRFGVQLGVRQCQRIFRQMGK